MRGGTDVFEPAHCSGAATPCALVLPSIKIAGPAPNLTRTLSFSSLKLRAHRSSGEFAKPLVNDKGVVVYPDPLPDWIIPSPQGSGSFKQWQTTTAPSFQPAFSMCQQSHRTATKTHTVWYLCRMASRSVGHSAQVISWYQTSITPAPRQPAISKAPELPYKSSA